MDADEGSPNPLKKRKGSGVNKKKKRITGTARQRKGSGRQLGF